MMLRGGELLVFGAGCALGGALLYAALGERRRQKDDPEEDEVHSPRVRRLLARSKSMSRSNAELSLLMEADPPEAPAKVPSLTTRYVSTEYGDVGGTFGARNKIVIAMVGLPARGKSYIVKMLVRYMEWIGFPTKIFNVGDLRRRRGLAGASADFFKAGDEPRRKREELAMACQEEMYQWLDAQPTSCVAIFDATNTTRARREALLRRSRKAPNYVTLIFIESICDDPKILHHNYVMKLQNADYRDKDKDEALKDFTQRVKEYEQRYETIADDEEVSYCKIINVGEKVINRKCSGYLSSQISFFLGNVHITPRKIWLALHAESVQQRDEGVIGSSAGGGLTEYGEAFSQNLATLIRSQHAAFQDETSSHPSKGGKHYEDLLVLIGNAKLHQQTVQPLLDGVDAEGDNNGYYSQQQKVTVLSSSLLNELCGGDFDGISGDELERRYPGVWKARQADKLKFRYPGAGGESYLDVISRLRPILIELERQKRSVLIVSHLAVQRCLYAYFLGTPQDQIPYLQFPRGAVVELTPTPHGATATTHVLVPPPTTPRSSPSKPRMSNVMSSGELFSFGGGGGSTVTESGGLDHAHDSTDSFLSPTSLFFPSDDDDDDEERNGAVRKHRSLS
mmetsp:Transcript_20357/g.62943  ORF Transcript_20357/g.62943 Transcript_20357/m.62943 type:complete len:623 (+) Transcript_20357:39-1907(+)